jgi:hypothetical protein
MRGDSMKNIRTVNSIDDEVRIIRSNLIEVEGTTYVLTDSLDPMYEDLKYVSFDGDIWVEE